MILRKIVTSEDYSPGWVMLKLECGHEVGPVSEQRKVRAKSRKRCPHCERCKGFKDNNPELYSMLLQCLVHIPPDDRTTTLLGWFEHLSVANAFAGRIPGLNGDVALDLMQPVTRYPLTEYWFKNDEEGPSIAY